MWAEPQCSCGFRKALGSLALQFSKPRRSQDPLPRQIEAFYPVCTLLRFSSLDSSKRILCPIFLPRRKKVSLIFDKVCLLYTSHQNTAEWCLKSMVYSCGLSKVLKPPKDRGPDEEHGIQFRLDCMAFFPSEFPWASLAHLSTLNWRTVSCSTLAAVFDFPWNQKTRNGQTYSDYSVIHNLPSRLLDNVVRTSIKHKAQETAERLWEETAK